MGWQVLHDQIRRPPRTFLRRDIRGVGGVARAGSAGGVRAIRTCGTDALPGIAAGFGQFTEARIRDADVLALAAKVAYEIDPANEYPRNYTGDLRVTLAGGEVREYHQPHLRGGLREPLTPDALAAKFHANLAHGGWPRSRAERLMRLCGEVFDRPRIELSRI